MGVVDLRVRNRFSRIAYLVLIGVCLTLPTYIYAFLVSDGNTIDRVFFGVSVIGFLLILIGVGLGLKKEVDNS